MRVCPICEVKTDSSVCSTHEVATVDEATWQQRQSLADGTIVAERYRIERELGDGGYGVVYLATQLAMERKVALKVLRQHLEGDPKAIKRFYREAKAASSLAHPNIVRIFDFGLDEQLNATFLVMEYVEGETLEAMIARTGPLTERRAALLLLQVARSLVAAHRQDIVHRDLKPANIMVSELPDGEEHSKVLDFGVAKILGEEGSKSLTRTGGPIGTPMYMSPEQVTGKEIDFRSDLYSLGCLLHEMLTGAPPYDAERAVAVMFQHVSDPPPPLPGAEVSLPMRRLHASLLSKEKRDRPRTTDAVVKALALIAEGTPGASGDLGDTMDPAPHLRTIEPVPPPSTRPQRAVAGVLVGVAAALALAFSFRASSSAPPPVAEPPPPAPIPTVELSFNSEPAGAAVELDGVLLGRTPHRLRVEAASSTRTVVFTKEGYEQVEERLVTDTSHAVRVVLRKRSGTRRPAKPPPPPTKPIKTSR